MQMALFADYLLCMTKTQSYTLNDKLERYLLLILPFAHTYTSKEQMGKLVNPLFYCKGALWIVMKNIELPFADQLIMSTYCSRFDSRT